MSAEIAEHSSLVRAEPSSERAAIHHIDDPDGELVRRWQAGEEEAFASLVKRHEGRVFGMLLRMLGNREEAEDVAQEALLSLHRHGRRFRGESRFSTFLYRVVANAALNRRRTLGRSRARLRGLEQRHAAGEQLPAAPRDPEDAAVGAEVQREVQRALLELSEDLRMAVVLFDLEGLPYREIARILDVPEGTIKSRIHRARSALRERLRGVLHSEAGEDVT